MKIIASECAAGLYPQNTLSGFRYCLETRVDGIEFDVHLSADGEVVVQHDYRLNTDITRNASGNWLEAPTAAIPSLSLSEIKSYDVGRYRDGSKIALAYPDYAASDNEEIPTLDEFLGELNQQAESKCELWLELKTTPLDRGISSNPEKLLSAVLEKLAASKLVERTILLAFEWDLLVAAKQAMPGIRTDFLSISMPVLKRLYPKHSSNGLEQIYGAFNPVQYSNVPQAVAAAGGDWWGPLASELTQLQLNQAREAGLLVNAWGVSSTKEAIEQALALKPDAITLSRPDLARRMLLPALK